jgi:tetratricopeptide (TPR) repeat protein
MLAEEQIQCGPDWCDQCDVDGRATSLATGVGEYDLGAVAGRLGGDLKPDVVVCLVDASWRSLPRNLAAFGCPRVLLVADTHHMNGPVEGMLRYAACEPFDRIVLLYDRHHLEFFRNAGIKNLFWFPGLTFPHSDAAVEVARSEKRKATLAFVGQVGKFHPRRTRLLDALVKAGVPLDRKVLAQDQALAHYGSATMGINASLNGDLNLRIFEVLASGGALLTDRLSPQSGLEDLFKTDREIITYGDSGELVERAKYQLSNLSETIAVGLRGAKWFDEKFSEQHRRQRFRSLALDGVQPEEFPLFPLRTCAYLPGDAWSARETVKIYEGVQELHKAKETVRVGLDEQSKGLSAMFSTLPRVVLVGADESCDLAVTSRANAKMMDAASYVWCWRSEVGDVEDQSVAKDPEHLVALGETARGQGALQLAIELGQKALAVAGEHQGARRLMGRTLVEKGQGREALPFLLAVLPDCPLDADVWFGLSKALLATDQPADAFQALRKCVEIDPQNVEAWLLLGAIARECGKSELGRRIVETVRTLAPEDARVRAFVEHDSVVEPKALKEKLTEVLGCLRRGDSESAQTLLESIERLFPRGSLNPETTAVARALGDLLKSRGKVVEALRWHHRAVGGDGDVSLSFSSERRHVVFVVQHGPFWPSTASVYQAFAADPQWKTTLVALPYLHPYYRKAEDQNAIFTFLKGAGVPYVPWDQFALTPGCADVVFLQNPYDITRPKGWRTTELMRLVPRIAYIPYAMEIGGGQENASMQTNLATQQLAWAVFARSNRHRAVFEQHCATGAAHVHVTGHPKMDALFKLPTARDVEIERFVAERKMVFWNPQFDVRPDGSAFGKGYSTFLRWQQYLPDEFARRPGMALVIRPHPLFFATLEQRRILTSDQIRNFLNRCSALGVLVDRNPAYLPVFAASTAMISDASSFLLEYAGTGRPLLYLHNPTGPGLNRDGEFVTKYCYTAETEEEIRKFLDLIESGQDPTAVTRRASYGEFMYLPPDGVGSTIKRTIESRLAKEADEGARPLVGTALGSASGNCSRVEQPHDSSQGRV